MALSNGAGWFAVRFTGANAPVYKHPNPKGLKRYHLYITRHFISSNKKLSPLAMTELYSLSLRGTKQSNEY